MSRKGPKQVLNKDLRHWRKNKAESHKLAETHNLYDKQLASRRRSHSQEVNQLTRELGTKLNTKPTPTVDEHLRVAKKRNENTRAADRAKAERRFNSICSTNMKGFKQLNIDSSLYMPPEVIARIARGAVKRQGSKNSDSSRRSSTTSANDTTAEETDDANKEVAENENKTETEKIEGDDTTNGNSGECEEEKIEDQEDQNEEYPESPDWHPGPRRYTLAALNERTDHSAESRRVSTGTVNLANILGVSLEGGKRGMEREKKRLRAFSECNSTCSEDGESHDEHAADSGKGE